MTDTINDVVATEKQEPAVMMTLPIIVIALFAQRSIVSGLVAGATRG